MAVKIRLKRMGSKKLLFTVSLLLTPALRVTAASSKALVSMIPLYNPLP